MAALVLILQDLMEIVKSYGQYLWAITCGSPLQFATAGRDRMCNGALWHCLTVGLLLEVAVQFRAIGLSTRLHEMWQSALSLHFSGPDFCHTCICIEH